MSHPAAHADPYRLVASSRGLVRRHQHAGGAYPAAPTFSAYRGYAWFRDGAFIAEGMSRAGEVGSASAFHDWCAAVLTARRDRVASLRDRAAAGAPPEPAEMLPTRFTLEGDEGADPWWDFQTDGYGTWLWAVAGHARRHDLDPARWRPGVEVAVDYLTAFWHLPCYDWWEENPGQRHVATLGAIYGGLTAVAGSLDGGRAPVARSAADRIRDLVLTEGVRDGHLTKWLGAATVDASLLACVVPFGLLRPDDPRAARTVERVRSTLVVDGGTHRYAADVFYGGGQWPLLTCLLGWNLLAGGDAAGAYACLAWAADRADPDGQLPEQVDDHLLAPDHEAEWVARWGPVARPLLWSHGMYLTLATALDPTLGETR